MNMNEHIQSLFADRASNDREVAYEAICGLFATAEEPVDWAYDVWDQLLSELEHGAGNRRAFAAQMLARLAISDPEGRMLEDFPRVAAVMRDSKTVTARHTLQSIWRVGLAGPTQRAMVVDALSARFGECAEGKHESLVRTDVVTALGKLMKATGDDAVERSALSLIEAEPDGKRRKGQAAAWRKAVR
jgi:hypothetical protein